MTRALTYREGTDCGDVAITVVSPCGSAWRELLRLRVNVLVNGPRRAVDSFIASAHADLEMPVCGVACDDRLVLKRARTLLLRDVDLLEPCDQARLYQWLAEPANATTQVVSTATGSLFGAVIANKFDDALYYRLNSLLLHVHES